MAFGQARGDELPPELANPQGPRKWLREAQRRLDEELWNQVRPTPLATPEGQFNLTDPDSRVVSGL